jgi:hypothetical protein
LNTTGLLPESEPSPKSASTPKPAAPAAKGTVTQ